MIATPRTDAHYKTTKTAWPTQGDKDFARQLERELEEIKKLLHAVAAGKVDSRLRREKEEYEKLVRDFVDAHNALHKHCLHGDRESLHAAMRAYGWTPIKEPNI